MNTIYRNIVDKNFINANQQIRGALYEKISSLLDNKKSEISQKMFAEEEVTEGVFDGINQKRSNRVRGKASKAQGKANRLRAKAKRLEPKKKV